MNAVVAVRSYAGPVVAAGTGTIATISTAYVLPIVGFCTTGVKAGLIAAGVQSVVYGASVPAGSAFATLQSWGATGAVAGALGVAALPVGIATAGGTYLVLKSLGSIMREYQDSRTTPPGTTL